MRKKWKKKLVCALFFGEVKTEKRANDIAKSLQNCSDMYLITTKEKQVFAVLFSSSTTDLVGYSDRRTSQNNVGLRESKSHNCRECTIPNTIKDAVTSNPAENLPL